MVDKGIPIRLVIYSVAILYIVIDLLLIGGPLRSAIFRKNPKSPEVIEAAKEQGVVARVYFQPIVLGQVDRRVEEDLWREGRRLEDLTPEAHLVLRRAALDTLIDLHLLRLKVRFNQDQVAVTEEEIERELAVFAKRFSDPAQFQAALERRGWSEKELRFRLAARLQQERYLEKMIDVQVSEEEARQWFEENKKSLAQPPRLRARHIFLSTLTPERSPEAARRELETVLEALATDPDRFAELAAVVSEDERTKEAGGDLGWMQAGRLPQDFGTAVFALEVGRRELVRSKIGWHLVEILEKKPARERSFEEARADVVATLEAVKRTEGLKLYRQKLRYRDKHKVEVFLDVLKRDLNELEGS